MSFNTEDFISRVVALRAKDHFNPYTDTCPEHDAPLAPVIRQRNLRAYLKALHKYPIKVAWIGRDYGYRGGRRTGLPLTDEHQLPLFQQIYETTPLSKATRTNARKELTASEIWQALHRHPPAPLLWNVVALHPHEPGKPMSNRLHSADAARQSVVLLDILLKQFKPRLILALGRDAHDSLTKLGFNSIYIRHPSYGGQADFHAGIHKHMPR